MSCPHWTSAALPCDWEHHVILLLIAPALQTRAPPPSPPISSALSHYLHLPATLQTPYVCFELVGTKSSWSVGSGWDWTDQGRTSRNKDVWARSSDTYHPSHDSECWPSSPYRHQTQSISAVWFSWASICPCQRLGSSK
jgi:hypothetical protein